jgi:SanA protein
MVRRAVFWIVVAALAAVAVYVVANAAMVSAEAPYMYASVDDMPRAPVIIVPGAAILRSGQLSPVFLERADAAIALYQAGKAGAILVSGDNSTLEHNEVDPARKYLVSQGVSEKNIYLDHAGFDTYSTMYRAKEIFGVTQAIVVTQSFHLPRSLFLAHRMGIDAVGYRSDRAHLLARNYVRESFARLKAMWDVTVNREPKFLGDKVPIV